MKFGKTEILILLSLLTVVLATGFYAYVRHEESAVRQSAAASALGDREGEASFLDIDGNTFSFNDYEDSVRVVNAWASWSPFSQKELQDLATLSKLYNSNDVVVLAVNRKEPAVQMKNFIRTVGDTGNVIFVQDPTDSFFSAIDGFSMPETIIYDTKGNIIFHKRGPISLDELKQYTESALVKQ